MNRANFGPIDDGRIFGACRPGHLGAGVAEWTEVLSEAGVSTVVCLLSESEAMRWGLPDAYDDSFRTHHLPIRDRHLPERERLARVLDVLEDETTADEPAVLHCNAGLGRTGVVGSAWLVRTQGLDPRTAVETVETGPTRRAPREAIRDDNATEDQLFDLLADI